MLTCNIRRASVTDAARIAHIYNAGIAERIATFETTLRRPQDMADRITANARHAVLVAERDGSVVGWAGISSYRPRACYDGVGEFSIYVDPSARGQGLGRQLLAALVEEAASLGYWKLLSRIFTFNTASRALCQSCGFREVGIYEKHAQLDGRWLDVVIVERLIPENQRRGLEAASVGNGERLQR
jgi:L-amino acid N-acyltransferase YncA